MFDIEMVLLRLELGIKCHHASHDQDRRTERARAPGKNPPQKIVADFGFKVRGGGGTRKFWKCEEGVPTVAVTQSKS